ncbi:MAG TPA: M48 family metalloprotease [Oscillatoriales cyanobacterium M59_W2019_021]|nr:MAG: peptidase M48 [Cyanobacteria bacterium J055]HIK33853.1 M48 family metalloprotease [Oscillatoriales cyanobacterium M4454_W2019_049]HIK51681.1 M48 family metalloprotease [Oscillatoriales cyanobacterium M59_W2019_021]
MKRLKHFFLAIFSAVFFATLSGQLLLSSQPARSTPPPIELAQKTPVNRDNPRNSVPSSASDRFATFLQADALYRQGDTDAAAQLYRQLKPELTASLPEIPEPIYEAEGLAPENLELWNTAQTAIDADDEEAAISALQQVVDNQPEFVPAPLKLAELLIDNKQREEAIVVLEKATTQHPYSAEIVMAQVKALSKKDKHLEASIAAREFSVLYLDNPQASELDKLAEEELDEYLDSQELRKIIQGIGGIGLEIFRGGNILEGMGINIEGLFGGGDVVELEGSAKKIYEIGQLMFENESEYGARLAEEYKQQATLVEDPEINDYVTQLGLEVAQLMGRDFDYEFYVVQDNSMNAFALPGGKVFVNTGAILASNSQAELAGVLAHEVSHAVLSHGIHQVLRGDLLNQVFGAISEELSAGDLGNLVSNLIQLDYSRKQEQQADILGTRILAKAGYAADGLRNFMATLAQHTAQSPVQLQRINISNLQIPLPVPTEYLSSHPLSDDRVQYLEELILRNGYNQYALEGVDKHSEIQEKLMGNG